MGNEILLSLQSSMTRVLDLLARILPGLLALIVAVLFFQSSRMGLLVAPAQGAYGSAF